MSKIWRGESTLLFSTAVKFNHLPSLWAQPYPTATVLHRTGKNCQQVQVHNPRSSVFGAVCLGAQTDRIMQCMLALWETEVMAWVMRVTSGKTCSISSAMNPNLAGSSCTTISRRFTPLWFDSGGLADWPAWLWLDHYACCRQLAVASVARTPETSRLPQWPRDQQVALPIHWLGSLRSN